MTTIVTCYYKLPISKASHAKYVEWMQNMLVIENPMVIFCDQESVDMIREFRYLYIDKTVIVPLKLEQFYTMKYYNIFLQHYSIDKEIRIGHNPLLYMIWSEKSNFLKRAIEMDPFQSDYFLWVDIGCFREPNKKYLKYPDQRAIEKLDTSKVLLLQVGPFTQQELACNSIENLPNFMFHNRIGGTIFGGGKDVLLKWHSKYYAMLETFIHMERFIGKDQSIINCVYLLNRDMCDVINWIPGCKDIWFYLQDYLSSSGPLI
jgi:hypothetical protein